MDDSPSMSQTYRSTRSLVEHTLRTDNFPQLQQNTQNDVEGGNLVIRKHFNSVSISFDPSI